MHIYGSLIKFTWQNYVIILKAVWALCPPLPPPLETIAIDFLTIGLSDPLDNQSYIFLVGAETLKLFSGKPNKTASANLICYRISITLFGYVGCSKSSLNSGTLWMSRISISSYGCWISTHALSNPEFVDVFLKDPEIATTFNPDFDYFLTGEWLVLIDDCLIIDGGGYFFGFKIEDNVTSKTVRFGGIKYYFTALGLS